MILNIENIWNISHHFETWKVLCPHRYIFITLNDKLLVNNSDVLYVNLSKVTSGHDNDQCFAPIVQVFENNWFDRPKDKNKLNQLISLFIIKTPHYFTTEQSA